VIGQFFRLALILIASAASAADTSVPYDVATFETDMGTHYTTRDGYTLYVYDGDAKPLQSQCINECPVAWPPLEAPADAVAIGDWQPFMRRDEVRQWAFRGRPVYKYAQDAQPRANQGDGVLGVWHIALSLKPRPPGVMFRGTIKGRVAAEPTGKTLYTREDNVCAGKCLKTWRPFLAPWAAGDRGDWSVVTRADDGSKQWAWRGHSLYTYVEDNKAGNYNGDGIDGWRALLIQPTPPLPNWVTVHPSDLGPVFADKRGMTLYTISELKRTKAEATCNDACLDANWTPILADENAKPAGNWSMMDGPHGKQWAYRALPLYAFKHDKGPGSIEGDKFALGGGNTGWRAAIQATLIEEPL